MLADMGGDDTVERTMQRLWDQIGQRAVLPDEVHRLDMTDVFHSHTGIAGDQIGLAGMIDNGRVPAIGLWNYRIITGAKLNQAHCLVEVRSDDVVSVHGIVLVSRPCNSGSLYHFRLALNRPRRHNSVFTGPNNMARPSICWLLFRIS